jgi:hypothetical protein
MAALPDRALMRAVADVVLEEEAKRAAADRELAGDLARLREKIDEYGNVIVNRFVLLEHQMRDLVAGIVIPPGEKGDRGDVGDKGEPGERGAPGEAGPIGYVGRACGRWNAEVSYRAMDVVALNGSEWRAIKDDPGPLPGNGWMLGAKGVKGDKGVPGDKGVGERGPQGLPGAPGQDGVGIADIVIEAGVLLIRLTDGRQKEFMVEAVA